MVISQITVMHLQSKPLPKPIAKPVFSRVRWWILWTSLGLNALLCWVLAGWVTDRDSRLRSASLPFQRSVKSQPAHQASGYSASTEPSEAGFTWDLLVSTDLRTYANNLRSVGCPEATVCDVLRGELDRIFAARLRAVVLAAGYWETAHQQRPARWHQLQERWKLIREKRAQARELTGQDWIARTTENATELALAEWLIGQSAPGLTEQVAALLEYYEVQASQINQLSLGIQIQEDLAAKEKLKSEMFTDLGQIMTAGQLTEFQARFLTIQNLVGAEIDAARLAGLTPGEFREFARKLTSSLQPLAEEILDLETGKANGPQWNLQLETSLAQVIDGQRATEFSRALDHEYRGIREFIQDHQLSRQVAIQLYDIYQAAQQEKNSILANEQLSTEEKHGLYTRLAEDSAEGVAALLGRNTSDYLQSQGKWIQVLAQRKK
jgi:hypothetical protein